MGKNVKKESWKECEYCGTITDLDEKYCPIKCVDENTKHKLRIVEFDKKELKRLYTEGKVQTKHLGDFEKRILKRKRPT
ncbi:MAG: hypothetical protein A2175_01710 [Candidatus Nealsonbacteria bacterium RBG_13_42_11]|uniref:Uncharacterized protein n=1 Tax=Candidatus Nealsonbacteria bacterium RBG_13_42_11 TaxID=1801663 RepID=A0A1G2DZJ8_9BACT|nr:MAG: hypothetical protein A2175_01710 [Candidatus Nealsonbacteria bacterium RBG_13_42_11]